MLKNMSNKSWRTSIDNIAIYNDQNKLVAFEGGFDNENPVNRVDLEVTDLNDPACWVCHEIPVENRPTMVLININGQQVMRNSVPLYNKTECNECHAPDNKVLGDSIIDIDLTSYQRTSSLILSSVAGLGLLAILTITLLLSYLINKIMLQPIDDLLKATQTVLAGNYNPSIRIRSNDELGKLGLAFVTMTDQLRNFIGNLEQIVADRTNALEKRSNQLRSVVHIGNQAIANRNLKDIINLMVQTISSEYEYKYVNIFLLDDLNENLVLVGSNDKVGENLIHAGLKVDLNEEGFMQSVIDSGEATFFLTDPNKKITHNLFEYFKSTYGIVLPLKIGNKKMGLLDLHGDLNTQFSDDDLVSMQLLSNQIAVAIDNAMLLSENKQNLDRLESVMGSITFEQWRNKLSKKSESFKYITPGIIENNTQNGTTSEMSASSKSSNRIESQISLRGQIIGKISISRANNFAWLESEKLLVDIVASQVALALENARILEDAQQKAAQEQVIVDLSRTPETEAILRTTAEILGKLLSDSKVTVRLQSNSEDSTNSAISEGH
jgi:nitrate/nitrite-specific signal transduction histidine kinase